MTESAIYVFAVYKFDAPYYRKNDLEKAIKNAVRNTEKAFQKKFKDLRLEYIEQQGIHSGERVDDFVIDSLNKSTLNIFELSTKSQNVSFELGYSMGISRGRFSNKVGYNILIRNSKVSYKHIFSDLMGKFVVNYKYDVTKDNRDIYRDIQRTIEHELKVKINNLLGDGNFLKGLIWKMRGEKVRIVCPYIPPRDQKKYGICSTLSEYGDFNAVYETSMFLSGILNCEVEYFHCKEARSVKCLFDDHLVIIGGTAWNDYAKELMEEHNLPLRYELVEDGDDCIVNTITNEKIYPVRQKEPGKEAIVKDCGIFAVLPSRYSAGKTVILISGITTLGGLGAARAFAGEKVSNKNCRGILEKIGFKNYFVALIESDVRWGEFPYPRKIRESNIFACTEVEDL